MGAIVELVITVAVLVALLAVVNPRVLGVVWWKKMNLDNIIAQIVILIFLLGVAANIVRLFDPLLP